MLAEGAKEERVNPLTPFRKRMLQKHFAELREQGIEPSMTASAAAAVQAAWGIDVRELGLEIVPDERAAKAATRVVCRRRSGGPPTSDLEMHPGEHRCATCGELVWIETSSPLGPPLLCSVCHASEMELRKAPVGRMH